MQSSSDIPQCPNFVPECCEDGFDIHLHTSAQGKVTVVSSVPTACSDDSPQDFLAALKNRGFVAFAVNPEGEEYEN